MNLTIDNLLCKIKTILGSKNIMGFFNWLAVIGSIASILGIWLALNDGPDHNNVERAISNLTLEIRELREKINALADGRYQKIDRYLTMLEKNISDGDILKTAENDESLYWRELEKRMYEELDNLGYSETDDVGSSLRKIEEQKSLLAHTPAIRPTEGWITVEFGYRKSPYTGIREFHEGITISNRKGTNIVATADGEIVFTGSNEMLGLTVKIDHGNGMITRYFHLEKILCISGEKVQRGDIIATMGASGDVADAAFYNDDQKTRDFGVLLYEVQLNGISINPSKYILN